MTLIGEHRIPWERRYSLKSARKKVEQGYVQEGQFATSERDSDTLLVRVWDEEPKVTESEQAAVPDVAEMEARILELEDTLAKERAEHAAEIENLTSQAIALSSAREGEKAQTQADKEAAQSAYEASLAALRSNHAEQLAKAAAHATDLSANLSAERDANIAEIARLRNVYSQEKTDMRNAHSIEMLAVRDAYAKEQAAERSAHSADLADLRETAAREMAAARNAHAAEISSLRENVATLTEQLVAERTGYAENLQMAASKAAIENARLQGIIEDLRIQTKSLFAVIKRKPEEEVQGDHAHRFDTQLADGAGWRCGVCGLSKKDYESGG